MSKAIFGKAMKGLSIFLFFLLLVVMTVYVIGRKNLPGHETADVSRSDQRTKRQIVTREGCHIHVVSLNETVNDLASIMDQDNYFILIRINVTLPDRAVYNETEETNAIHPNRWHWVTGRRGKTLLTFPYDFESLSLGSMKHGIHEASVTLEYSQPPALWGPDKLCVVHALVDLMQKVAAKIEASGGSASDFEDDLLCREEILPGPFFRGTLIPGYSIFELQASSYFDCFTGYNNVSRIEKFINIHRDEKYECYLVFVLFIVTYALLFLAMFYKIWQIYAYPNDILHVDGSSNEEEVARAEEGQNSQGNIQPGDGRRANKNDDSVNILRISTIPPVLLLLALSREREQKYKRLFHLFYWISVFLMPLLIYVIAFLVYVSSVEEYQRRSMLLGFRYQTIGVWFLDFFLANIMYVAGATMFVAFLRRYSVDDQEEEAFNWGSKKRKLTCYAVVAALCFFRFSATVLLILEIFALIVVGIAINIRFVVPAWVNVLAGLLIFVVNVVRFFDKYHELFNNIYSVGKDIDRENHQHKIFTQRNRAEGRPQTRFEISSELLRDIIKKKLPLHVHFLNTVMHVVVALAFIAIAAVIVIVIDRSTDISKIVEYLLTGIFVLAVGARDFRGNPCSASNKQKNTAEDRRFMLQEDLRIYAETGQFPPPSTSCWASCCSCCKRKGNSAN